MHWVDERAQTWVLLKLENSAVCVQAIHFFILGLSLLICKMGTVSLSHRMAVVT